MKKRDDKYSKKSKGTVTGLVTLSQQPNSSVFQPERTITVAASVVRDANCRYKVIFTVNRNKNIDEVRGLLQSGEEVEKVQGGSGNHAEENAILYVKQNTSLTLIAVGPSNKACESDRRNCEKQVGDSGARLCNP